MITKEDYILSFPNKTQDEKTWNSALLSIEAHKKIGNSFEYAIQDLTKRFPEYRFTAVSSICNGNGDALFTIDDIIMEPRNV